MGAITPILSYALPLIGKILLMIPIVPNKAIPFILGLFNVAHKYWLLLGFPTLIETATGNAAPEYLTAGVGGWLFSSGVPFVWGIAEQFLFHKFYEGEKATARLAGKVSWWEAGKRSMYGPKVGS